MKVLYAAFNCKKCLILFLYISLVPLLRVYMYIILPVSCYALDHKAVNVCLKRTFDCTMRK